MMGDVWLAIPSARPDGGRVRLWRARGYKVALWVDPGADVPMLDRQEPLANILIQDEYPGYARAVNGLCAQILKAHPDVNWIVTGGDDVEPDPSHAPGEIAQQCSEHFGVAVDISTHDDPDRTRIVGGTFGVMQPTGDRFAQGSIDRIAGSPWMGREWCLRVNGGQGPLWPEFDHMFVDEALQAAAQHLGVYWQRPDLVHLHHHYMRESGDLNSPAVTKPVPDHLRKWAGREHWDKSKAIYQRLRAESFTRCMPVEPA